MKSFVVFLIIGIVLLVGLFFVQQWQFSDGTLRVVFCDVGQGDAILIRTPRGSDILVDGGPDEKVLSCVSEHMPFWDRTLELVMLSHPHADHLIGFLSLLDRYSVEAFATEKLTNATPEFEGLMKKLQEKKIDQRYLYVKDSFTTPDGVRFTVLGPSKQYLQKTSPNGVISSGEFASLIVQVNYGDFDVLLTGDSQAEGLQAALGGSGRSGGLGDVEILQAPHHGSKTGLTSALLARLKPKLSVISVGKNTYGHPAKETLDILREGKSKILRTDQVGNIEIRSNGKEWWVR